VSVRVLLWAVCLASGTACATACDVQAVPGVLGCRGHRRGYIAADQPRPVSPVTTEKIKKAQKKHPTPYCQSQKFRKNKKDPYKGSVFCAILALQALKGRNLQ
jgi:hypothetical protein